MVVVLPPDPASVRAHAAEWGLFFDLARPRPDEDWQPVSQWYLRGGTDPLGALLDAVHRTGGGECRVAASLLYQGFASRLWSPQLAWLLIDGVVAPPDPDTLVWRRPVGQLFTLAAPPDAGRLTDPQSGIATVIDTAFEQHLDPLSVALRDRVPVSAELLRGNASAALVSGLLLAHRAAGRSGSPPLLPVVLRHRRLRGTGVWTQRPPRFVRRSCCLYYRTPTGGTCGDCPLPRRITAPNR